MTIGRSTAAREAIDRLGVLADRLSHPLAGRLPGMRAMNLAWGPTPVPEALEATEALLRDRAGRSGGRAVRPRPGTPTCSPRPETSRRRAPRSSRMRGIAERQGQRIVLWASWGQNVGRTELLAGDPERAERALRPVVRGAAGRREPRLLVDARRAARARARRARTPRRGVGVRRGRARRGGRGRRAVAGSVAERAVTRACAAGGRGAIAGAGRRGRSAGRDDRVAERPRRHAPRPGACGSARRPRRRCGRRHRARDGDISRQEQHGRVTRGPRLLATGRRPEGHSTTGQGGPR